MKELLALLCLLLAVVGILAFEPTEESLQDKTVSPASQAAPPSPAARAILNRPALRSHPAARASADQSDFHNQLAARNEERDAHLRERLATAPNNRSTCACGKEGAHTH